MKASTWISAAVAALLLLASLVFIIPEGQTALVLNLGKVVRADLKPGLHFKMPLVESLRRFDRRLQVLAAPAERYLTSERKDVAVDFFAIGRIEDVRAFYRATGGDEDAASARLAPIIKDALRNEINARTLQQVVSGSRADVIGKQLENINIGAKNMGVRIVDLRIKQIDLPTDSRVISDVYSRMRAQRQQVASRLRAEGEEQANQIRAEADAQTLRGQGDAEATRLYAEAANRDPSFYAFQRSLEAYRKAFSSGDNVIVLERNDPFLQYMRSDR